MPSLSLAEAEALVKDALCRCRTSADNAALVARALVRAEAEGLKSHGLLRVPMYAAQAKVGKVDGFAVPAVEQPRPALLAIDAETGTYYTLDEARTVLDRRHIQTAKVKRRSLSRNSA